MMPHSFYIGIEVIVIVTISSGKSGFIPRGVWVVAPPSSGRMWQADRVQQGSVQGWDEDHQ